MTSSWTLPARTSREYPNNSNSNSNSKNPKKKTKKDDDAVIAMAVAVEEEDWSEFMTSNLSAGSFAQHEILQEIELTSGTGTGTGTGTGIGIGDGNNKQTLKIASTASLSPLDMVDLSWGTHDATGHCVWMGAKLFLQALRQSTSSSASTAAATSVLETSSSIALLKPSYFQGRRILELGSGTGLAGLAVAKTFGGTDNHEHNHNDNSQPPQVVVLTDNSESALQLCRQNCQSNGIVVAVGLGGVDKDNENENDTNDNVVQVEFLSWGNALPDETKWFDTVLATDVIYDLGALEPLLETTVQSLKDNGIFLLSHVPRADYHPETQLGAGYCASLEEYVIHKAQQQQYNLELLSILRPSQLQEHGCCPGWEEMEQAGAAILIFQKKAKKQQGC